MTLPRVEDLYSFAYRGHLATNAMEQLGVSRTQARAELQKLERVAALGAMDPDLVADARRMGVVYIAIASFEKTLRNLVQSTMVEEYGDKWWKSKVSQRIRDKVDKRMAEEPKHRWHKTRGDSPLDYTDMTELASIFLNHSDAFDHVITADFEWLKQILHVIEKSRNVIMHSGELDLEDVERIGINIRDWGRQVGL